jgi:hypothetical protein
VTDRELLEAAARAAGVEISHGPEGVLWRPVDGKYWVGRWNPLEDNAAALLLAVKLHLSIIHEEQFLGGESTPTIEVIGPERDGGSRHCEMHSLDDDPAANVRRCIVRAAAAMAG